MSLGNNENSKEKKINAAILVLGDLNRSPRMLNHAAAISSTVSNINQISLIGFNGGDLRSDIKNDPKIKTYFLSGNKINKFLAKLPSFLFILSALIKICVQLFLLFWYLMTIPKPDFLILQNPPGIPAIFICLVVCFIRRTKFILDWHNYGYTILKVNKRNKIIVFVAYLYEKILGRFASISLCVSKAMKEDLKKLGIKNAIELPDRAMPGIFNPDIRENLKSTYDLLNKYKDTFNVNEIISHDSETKSLQWEKNRPIILLSSTSWTPDEDFYMLLDSIVLVEETIKEYLKSNNLDKKLYKNRVQMIITGRGPMKDKFMKDMMEKNLEIVEVKSIWLDSDDYPKLLSVVDIGICLHYSSSGFDLPMKVVDMFSAGLPVLAVEYPTIKELVCERKNGYLFSNKKDLSSILGKNIIEFLNKGKNDDLEEMRSFIKKDFRGKDWISQWREKLLPHIKIKEKI